ncbi:hypothetical protein GCM10012286_53990 [Streptomyces lasiicapitis]|uniref:Uncharacterized protein n=1 Tax=Streptomyces lasiicapitis TaxID=1923961 RepID=A0ABQ2MGF1_9ACTN|nr:hypothetical protein GCM10012286_53990 [Streptomyces lasiicapitis]
MGRGAAAGRARLDPDHADGPPKARFNVRDWGPDSACGPGTGGPYGRIDSVDRMAGSGQITGGSHPNE